MRILPLLLAIFCTSSPVYGQTQTNAPGYCLAIRGNGDAVPAHWAAMANLVEKLGLPTAQAGGSSATITMMLNEAIAANKYLRFENGELNRVRAALVYKSLEGFIQFLTASEPWKDFSELQRMWSVLKVWPPDIGELQNLAAGNSYETLRSNIMTAINLGLISRGNWAPLMQALGQPGSDDQIPRIQFYAGELVGAIQALGKFEAETDANLFFRPGVIDFPRLAYQLGRVATFYSGNHVSAQENSLWQQFLSECADQTRGRTWKEIAEEFPQCTNLFNQILSEHFNSKQSKANFSQSMIGNHIKSFPTTAVLVGTAHREAKESLNAYHERRDPQFGLNFFLSNPTDLRFGYWGTDSDLQTIDANLPKNIDEKSRRFYPLGRATWQTVLSLSPAEPGISAMKPFRARGTELTSVGGWSDLSPVLVLKASGCERVVYLTRRGRESKFAYSVAKRLFTKKGQPDSATKTLRQLFDLSVPSSSMRRSVVAAGAVLCTDWDRFDAKAGELSELMSDAYRASPYFIRDTKLFPEETLAPRLHPRDTLPDGRPIYEGCF